jgi:twitching motility two-component system response regulator PilG
LPKILVVDDSPTVLRIVEISLAELGFEILQAKDGLKALKVIKEEEPDIVVLDVMLPIYTGYQVCQLIKKTPKFENIPVILLTAKTGALDKLKGKMAHADMYLTKPFSKEDLQNAVIKLLRRNK